MRQLLLAIALNLAVGLAAYLKKAVSRSGFACGVAVGVAIYLFGGPLAWALLGGFFLSSSLLSFYGRGLKGKAEALHGKGAARDHLQVLANSLAACLMAALYYYTKEPVWMLGVAVAFAASNADTWASELGMLSPGRPVMIVGFRRVERGTSGAVSILGLLASLAGALCIALIFVAGTALLEDFTAPILPAAACIAAGGFAGSLIDSLLGATLQAQYRSPKSGLVIEKKMDGGAEALLIRGIRFIDNDMVNLMSSALAVAIVISVHRFFPFM